MKTATPISKWPGKFGTCVVWDCGDRHVITSSTDNKHVRETVAFPAERERGGFHGYSEIAVVKSAESHSEAIQAAGYTPAPIPADLPVSEVPS